MKWPSLKRKRSQGLPAQRASEHKTDAAHFRAVSIASDLEVDCTACKEQRGKRYLMHEAPSLPLPNCDAAHCRCRYVRYPDRREEARRDADVGIGGRPHLSSERRASRSDRRSD